MQPMDEIQLLYDRQIILTLIRDGIVDREVLARKAKVSRPTLNRALRELEGADFIYRHGSNCGLTAFGALVFARYIEFHDSIVELNSAKGILSPYRSTEVSVDSDLIEGGEIHVPPDRDPHGRIWNVFTSTKPTDSFDSLLSVLSPSWARFITQTIAIESIDGTFCIHSKALPYLEETYMDCYNILRDAANITLLETTKSIKANIHFIDGSSVLLVFYSDRGQPIGVIKNNTEEAVMKATQQLSNAFSNSSQVLEAHSHRT